ncbi:MAG: hypothetical protein ABI151_00600 [Chitinophagaceae bacterium]
MLALWVVFGVGVVVLLVAAVNVKTGKHCQGYQIDISGAEDFMFLDRDDLVKIITKDGSIELKGKELDLIDLHNLETEIAHNIWVSRAELFFDNNLVLHVNVVEKEPVARVFTKTGTSFYIDSSGVRLPLSDKMSVKLPVFTSFPEVNGVWNANDSTLIQDVKRISEYILHDPFWMAQVAQVSCEPEGNFELVPMLGNHRIIFGSGEHYESKFRRLFLFYKEVLSKAGLDKFTVINVAYGNQVVATRKSSDIVKRSLPPVVPVSSIDSSTLRTTN